MISSPNSHCPLCGGKQIEGITTFTADLQNTLVVVRGVPATICSLCGSEWLSDATAANLELIVSDGFVSKESIQFKGLSRKKGMV